MAIMDMLLPQYGMGMQDADITKWLKAVGEPVAEGEPVVEIEAAKTTVEVPAPASGRLVEILAAEGETVEVRAVIARIETA